MNALHRVRAIAMVVKEGNKEGEATCALVQQWLRDKGVPFSVSSHPDEDLTSGVFDGADLLLVFAGDGTMVSVARRCMALGIPVAGVNFGRVGFLAELTRHTWQQALQDALDNGLRVEPRMSLRYTLSRDGKSLYEGEVVNDVVVTRGKVARLVSLRLAVNGEPFVTLRSDGLILSTPTGSSGYAGSAGGPLMFPTLNSYVVAAICPYLSSFPPLVLGPEMVFSVSVGEVAPDLYLTLDGQEAYALAEGDDLEVSGIPGRVLMADFGMNTYFKRLSHAGFVQESKRQC